MSSHFRMVKYMNMLPFHIACFHTNYLRMDRYLAVTVIRIRLVYCTIYRHGCGVVTPYTPNFSFDAGDVFFLSVRRFVKSLQQLCFSTLV